MKRKNDLAGLAKETEDFFVVTRKDAADPEKIKDILKKIMWAFVCENEGEINALTDQDLAERGFDDMSPGKAKAMLKVMAGIGVIEAQIARIREEEGI